MKRIIMLAIALCFVATPIYASTVQEQYVGALQQIIQLLQQEVSLLLQQLNALQIAPPTQPVPVTTVTPIGILPAPVFDNIVPGSTPSPTPSPVPQPTPSPTPVPIPSPIVLTVEMVGICISGDKVNPQSNAYQVHARYIENGKKKLDVPITFSSPIEDGFFNGSGDARIQTEHIITKATKPLYNGFAPNGDARASTQYCSVKTSGITFIASTNGLATTTIITPYLTPDSAAVTSDTVQ